MSALEIKHVIDEMVKRHEGFRKRIYTDTTGHLTVGWGHNLTDQPIKGTILDEWYDDDVKIAIVGATAHFPTFTLYPPDIKAALVSMVFNLGTVGFGKFKNMISAINDSDWETAADEALDSKWATQVGDRATEIAGIIRKGMDQ